MKKTKLVKPTIILFLLIISANSFAAEKVNPFPQIIGGSQSDVLYALNTDGTLGVFGASANDLQAIQQINKGYDVISVSSGCGTTIVAKKDGTVWGWGDTGNYKLGTQALKTISTPIQISGLSKIVKVAMSCEYALALDSDGKVWFWGLDYAGNKANEPYNSITGGSNSVMSPKGLVTKTSPTVISLPEPVNNIAVGRTTSFAFKTYPPITRAGRTYINGASNFYAWGSSSYGGLGLGGQYAQGKFGIESYFTGVIKSTPVSRQFPGASQLQAGDDFAVALSTNGSVYSWGICTTTFCPMARSVGSSSLNFSPVKIPSFDGVTAVAAGNLHSIFLKKDNTVWGAGYNNFSQIGCGSLSYSNDKYAPKMITSLSLPINITSIAAGRYYSAVMTQTGNVYVLGNKSCSPTLALVAY